MKKQGILLTAVVLFGAVALAQAQEDTLGVTLDTTWVSKYLWYGIDALDDKGAFQPSVDVDLFGSGFSLNVWASYPTSVGTMNKGTPTPSSRVDATEYDYTVAYSTTFCKGEAHEVAVTAHGRYYDFIDQPDVVGDAHEIGVQLALPEVCPPGVVPSYFVGRIWPARSNSALGGNSAGWVHIFGMGYDLELPGLSPATPEQVVSFSAAAVYNDGFARAGVDHDWSHALFGVSTSFELAENVHLTPAFYYQSSWEDSVNPEDEMVFSIGASCRF
ncbi:MAG: hypothetical protein JSW59_00700 [Phycisphaerales bacterium]|nr:MAG: hypothetical protein JSW59_00700 [Phycisphaerales bacterium]